MISGNDARRFRLQLLNVYAAWDEIVDVAGNISGDTAWNTVKNTPWSSSKDVEMFRARDEAAKIASEATGNVKRYAVRDGAWIVAGDTPVGAAKRLARSVLINSWGIAKCVAESGGSPQQIAYACCKSIILDRKQIYNEIDSLGSNISSTSIGVDIVAKICETMMDFENGEFETFQLTIPLKMYDCLLSYEKLISFLRNCTDNIGVVQYRRLMNKHLQLVRRLGFETSYSKLKAPQHDVNSLSNYLPMLPMVLVKIIVDYDYLHVENSEDLDEIYNRLLKSASIVNDEW